MKKRNLSSLAIRLLLDHHPDFRRTTKERSQEKEEKEEEKLDFSCNKTPFLPPPGLSSDHQKEEKEEDEEDKLELSCHQNPPDHHRTSARQSTNAGLLLGLQTRHSSLRGDPSKEEKEEKETRNLLPPDFSLTTVGPLTVVRQSDNRQISARPPTYPHFCPTTD
ncbi:hypothetical protein M5K25_007534 [Dendrobium thyrsiflorum]|uniref:Uncharacterized protein n=1 Tax=Dendrobium thyrsiflorum TaxID=117978 RepID=A0ABD0VFT4_DENTH